MSSPSEPKRPKPQGTGPEYAAWFKDPGIIAAYHHRPPYPREAFDLVAALAIDAPRAVLDVGCGTGDIARRLAPLVDRVDAVDFSAGMIVKGRGLPGGDWPNLNWIIGTVEQAPLRPPYALITAGESLHWMDWDVVIPRFGGVLSPNGVLAIVTRHWDGPPALRERLIPIFGRYAARRANEPYDLAHEIALRGFRKLREKRTAEAWRPTIDEYVECRHAQNSFSRDRMGADQSAAFDAAVRETLERACNDSIIQMREGRLDLQVEATVIWGKPLAHE